MRDVTTLLEMPPSPLGKRSVILGFLGIAAIAGIMSLAAGFGELLASTVVLGGLFITGVLINPIAGIIALLGTLMLGLPSFLAGVGRLTANNLIGLLLLGIVTIQLCMKRDFWFVRSPQVLLLFLIALAFIVSLVHSWYVYIPVGRLPKEFTENTLFLVFSRLAFLVMFVHFIKTEKQVLVILVSILLFTMVVIPSAFYNLLTYKGEVDVITGKVEEFRIASEISSWGKNENRLAFMCNISILSVWMFAQIRKTKGMRIIATLTILMLATLVLATISRSGFLSLGFVFLFLLSQKGIASSLRVGVVGAVLFCALVFWVVLPPKASERLLNYSVDQSERSEGWRSTQSRLETNAHALEVFKEAPLLGVGPGNFRWLHRQLYPYTLAAGRPNHNSYLWAATEGGSLVLALYLLLAYFIWRDLRQSQAMYSQDQPLWHVTRFVKGYLMIFIFFSAFADFWLEPHFYLLAGLSMLVRRLAPDAAAPLPAPSRRATSVAAITG